MARPIAENPRTKITNIRLTEEERAEFEAAAAAQGYKNISEYIRFLHAAFSEATEGRAEEQWRKLAQLPGGSPTALPQD